MTSVRRYAAWALGATMMLLGCGNDSAGPDRGAYEALYAIPSSSPDTSTVFGTWGNKKIIDGGQFVIEARIRLQPKSVAVATRCSRSSDNATLTVGVTVEATVTETSIRVTEEKRDVKNFGADDDGRCEAFASKFEDTLDLSSGKLRFGSGGDTFEKFAD